VKKKKKTQMDSINTETSTDLQDTLSTHKKYHRDYQIITS